MIALRVSSALSSTGLDRQCPLPPWALGSQYSQPNSFECSSCLLPIPLQTLPRDVANGTFGNPLLLHASTGFSCLLRPVHARHESLSGGTLFPLSHSPAWSFACLNLCPHIWVFAVYPRGRLLEHNNCFLYSPFYYNCPPCTTLPLGLSPGYGTLWALNKDGWVMGWVVPTLCPSCHLKYHFILSHPAKLPQETTLDPCPCLTSPVAHI